MKKFLFSIALMMMSIQCFSQDRILRTNGETVDCKITDTDSTTVYFTIYKNRTNIQTQLNKSEVLSVEYGNRHNNSTLDTNTTEVDPSLNKIRIAVTGGVSIAVSDFGSNDEDNEKAGGAGFAGNYQLYLTHKITPNFGVGFKWYKNYNKYNVTNDLDVLNAISSSKYKANQSYFESTGVLFGFVGIVPSGPVTFEYRLLMGPTTIKTPESVYTLDSPNYNYNITLEQATAKSFGYNIGIGLDYLFAQNWSFLVNMDYVAADYNFDQIVMKSSAGEQQISKDVNLPYSVFNISVGIGLNF